jgi:S-adenosylmethionine decarboxylase
MTENGIHLIIDACKVNGFIDNQEKWQIIFDRIIDATYTNKIGDSVFYKFPVQGLTGFQILSESHISVHTYPEFSSYHLDVFSCKWFDYNRILNILTDVWGVHEFKYTLITR